MSPPPLLMTSHSNTSICYIIIAYKKLRDFPRLLPDERGYRKLMAREKILVEFLAFLSRQPYVVLSQAKTGLSAFIIEVDKFLTSQTINTIVIPHAGASPPKLLLELEIGPIFTHVKFFPVVRSPAVTAIIPGGFRRRCPRGRGPGHSGNRRVTARNGRANSSDRRCEQQSPKRVRRRSRRNS